MFERSLETELKDDFSFQAAESSSLSPVHHLDLIRIKLLTLTQAEVQR